jgi:hypothetical protein
MNEEQELPGEGDFFSTEEVYQIAALVNEKLAGVVYHYWVNKASAEVFEVLDWITLRFESGNSLTLTGGLDSDGIKIVNPDFSEEQKRLEKEFEGKVTIESRNASKHKVWKDCIGQEMTPSLVKVDGKVLNDSLVLKFPEADAVIIFLGLEGLEVDYYEDDESEHTDITKH